MYLSQTAFVLGQHARQDMHILIVVGFVAVDVYCILGEQPLIFLACYLYSLKPSPSNTVSIGTKVVEGSTV